MSRMDGKKTHTHNTSSVVTEKDDLLFQFTYHAFLLAVDFQRKNTERHALTLLVKSITVLYSASRASYVFQEYFLRFSDPKKTCLKYMNFSTTYQLSYQERPIILIPRCNETKWYIKYTLRWRNSRGQCMLLS